MTSKPFFHALLLRLAVCCLLAAACVGRAQTTSSERPETPRFRTIGWGVQATDLYYSLGGKDVPVSIFDAGRSGFHRLPQGESIAFYRLVKNEKGEAERVPAAEVSVAAAGPLPLLVFLPDVDDEERYRIVAVADDLETFPDRACRFVNLTKVTINATVGGDAVVVPGGEERVVDTRMPAEENTRYTSIFVDIRDGRVMLSYNNWVFRPGQRTLVFIFLDKLGRPRVVRVVDGIHQLKPTGRA